MKICMRHTQRNKKLLDAWRCYMISESKSQRRAHFVTCALANLPWYKIKKLLNILQTNDAFIYVYAKINSHFLHILWSVEMNAGLRTEHTLYNSKQTGLKTSSVYLEDNKTWHLLHRFEIDNFWNVLFIVIYHGSY